MTSRVDAVIKIDEAATLMEEVISMLNSMGCTYNMTNRVQSIIERMDALRVDVMQADLLNEGDCDE